MTDKQQQALDKMAENAREIGLDYEPVWNSGPTNKDYEDAMRAKGLLKLTAALEQPAQQEPEWYHGVDEHGCNRFYHKTEVRPSKFKTPLYTRPQAREPLHQEHVFEAYRKALGQFVRTHEEANVLKFARAIEAAHGIKGDA